MHVRQPTCIRAILNKDYAKDFHERCAEKYFLIISFLTVCSIALIYGISPIGFARTSQTISPIC
jgi:hypothetical protein